jgi:hypothetical protein
MTNSIPGQQIISLINGSNPIYHRHLCQVKQLIRFKGGDTEAFVDHILLRMPIALVWNNYARFRINETSSYLELALNHTLMMIMMMIVKDVNCTFYLF